MSNPDKVKALFLSEYQKQIKEDARRIAELEAELKQTAVQMSKYHLRAQSFEGENDDLRAKLAASETMVSQMATAHEYRFRQHGVTEDKLAASEKLVGELAAVVEGIKGTMDDAVRAFEDRGKGGQQVPFHGDFCSVPPSAIARFRWWSERFSAALAKVKP